MFLETPIYSEKIFLRSLRPTDVTPTYLGWLSDPEINAYLEVRFSPPKSINELASFVSDANASSDTLMLGIFLRSNGLHIGNIKLGPIDWNHNVGELGFLIGYKEQFRKGYASEAISLLTTYAFEKLSLVKLTSGCYAENEGSRRALLNSGYIQEGRRISQWVLDGKRQDGILMGQTSPSITLLESLKAFDVRKAY